MVLLRDIKLNRFEKTESLRRETKRRSIKYLGKKFGRKSKNFQEYRANIVGHATKFVSEGMRYCHGGSFRDAVTR